MIRQNEKFPYHELSIEERILLVEDIWDSIAEEQAKMPLSEAQSKLIQQRLAEYEANPDDVVTWEEMKKRLRDRLDEYRSRR